MNDRHLIQFIHTTCVVTHGILSQRSVRHYIVFLVQNHIQIVKITDVSVQHAVSFFKAEEMEVLYRNVDCYELFLVSNNAKVKRLVTINVFVPVLKILQRHRRK
jgi:hypothetical protein